jgi:TonB family protein
LLFLIAAAQSSAQNPTPSSSPSQLSAEQKAALDEASGLMRRVVELNRIRMFNDAIPLTQRAIELRQSVLGERDPLVAESFSNLGVLYVGKQEFERGEKYFRTALAIYESGNGPTENMGFVLDSLALLRWRERDYDKAEAYAKRAIELKQKVHGEQTAQLMESLGIIVKIYASAGRTTERNNSMLRWISMLEKGKNSPSDPQTLIVYRCELLDGRQTPGAVELARRIEALLKWDPSSSRSSSRGILNGWAISLPKPEYPVEARADRESGLVVVEIEIDECGRVAKAKALSGGTWLRLASELAALRARFTPTMFNGLPVRVTGVIHYNFVRR